MELRGGRQRQRQCDSQDSCSALHSLRPCRGQGASQGKESVLADSGREGKITAGVGRLRSPACLNILRGILFFSRTWRPSIFYCTEMVFPQLASRMLKKAASQKKVEVQAKVEVKRV